MTKGKLSVYLSGVLLGLILGVTAASVLAQAPAAPAPVATASGAQGVLDDTDKLLIEIVSVRAQLANNECAALDNTKQFIATRQEALKRIEAKHPGYTLDASLKLVAKPAQK